MKQPTTRPIGIFDSGYGGLTVFKEIAKQLPQHDYLYLGDNARAPYGPRSFDTIYQYTLQAVQYLFGQGCPLVILACNTASAKALRSIQQNDLPKMADPTRRVLGVVRPTTEQAGHWVGKGGLGILATQGTVLSRSYPLEIAKFYPDVQVFQQACPMWVPLIENNEHEGEGADYFVKEYLDALFAQSPNIDAILLACTHYPLIINKINKFIENDIKIYTQGELVAQRLADYLQRHPEMAERLTQGGNYRFRTTGDPSEFDLAGVHFFGAPIRSERMQL
jgi:glutamate racemase